MPTAGAQGLDILYIGTLPPHPGGAAISCGQLLAGLGSRNAVRAVAPITAAAASSGDCFADAHPELNVKRFPVPYFDTTPYIPVPEDYRRAEVGWIDTIVPALIAERRPDVLLIGRETFAWRAPEIAREHHLPSVLLMRGFPSVAIFGGTFPEDLGRQFIERYRLVDLIVVPANHFVEGLHRYGLGKVEVIANAVDTNRFAPRSKSPDLLAAHDVPREDVVVATMGGLHRRKRPLDFVHGAALALERNDHLTFLVVGDGALREEVEEACRSLEILDRFRFPGWVDYDRVPDYVNLADVMVMTSEGEGLARVYLEAQACGRVLVVSDIPPAHEVVQDGETGLLFGLGDHEMLAEKILFAAADAQAARRIGARARAQVVQHHSIDDAVRAYEVSLGRVARKVDS